MSLRLKVINLLNDRLRNGHVDDDCVTSVAFLAFIEVSHTICILS
jgi:hypothetical protein